MARCTIRDSPNSVPPAISAASFHTCRLDPPSSNDAMSAVLGAMIHSRTRGPRSAAMPAVSSRSSAIAICSSQMDSR